MLFGLLRSRNGAFTNDGSFPDGLPAVNSYSPWEAMGASDYYYLGTKVPHQSPKRKRGLFGFGL